MKTKIAKVRYENITISGDGIYCLDEKGNCTNLKKIASGFECLEFWALDDSKRLGHEIIENNLILPLRCHDCIEAERIARLLEEK